jgi:hypothetical protein
LASILCGTSNLELTIIPGRNHEFAYTKYYVTWMLYVIGKNHFNPQ